MTERPLTITLPAVKRPCLDGLYNHHRLIESPRGPTSAGTCKHCGSTREFSNSFYGSPSRDEPGTPFTSQRIFGESSRQLLRDTEVLGNKRIGGSQIA